MRTATSPRWYDPSAGQFLNEDPSGFNGGNANLYRYCGNNSPNYNDPTGLCYASSSGYDNTYYNTVVDTSLWGNSTITNANPYTFLTPAPILGDTSPIDTTPDYAIGATSEPLIIYGARKTPAKTITKVESNYRFCRERWASARRFHHDWAALRTRKPSSRVAISKDEGKTFEHFRNIADDAEEDYGYRCLEFLDDNRVLIAYHARDGVHVARINLDWFYEK
jgi:hypothetical protein